MRMELDAALHWAAANGRVEVINVLVQLGADKEAKAAYGATPLHAAAGMRQVEAIKALEQLGAQIDAQTVNGETPLKHPDRSPSGGAGAEGAGTHRTRTEGGGDQRACTAGD
jgi:ankyrin repeat protein